MARKQAITKETVAAAAPAISARAAKPGTPRVKAAKHSKTMSVEPAVVAAPANMENPTEAIARIAYSYWEARGCQGGSAIEDWVRAEHEYRQHAATPRLA